MKKFVICLVTMVFLFHQLAVFALEKGLYGTTPPEITAQGVYIADLGEDVLSDNDDTIFFQKDFTAKMYPASLVKIMTAIVVLDKYSVDELKKQSYSLSSKIKNNLYEEKAATALIQEKETLTLYDLLYCMLLPSGCDAAEMLAEKAGDGDREVFVGLMNAKAHQIGATSTNFTNPTGLQDANQYTTIANMALIAKYAFYKMKNNELFRQIVSSSDYTLPKTNKQEARKITNTNKLISDSKQKYDGILGIKTGTTTEAGTCLISLYKKNTFEILTIVMKAANNENGQNAFTDTRALLDWVSIGFVKTDIAKKGSPVITTGLKKAVGGKNKVDLYFNEEIIKIVPKNELANIVIKPNKDISVLQAPLKKGQNITLSEITLNNEVLASGYLIVLEDVNKDLKYYLLDFLPFILGFIILIVVIFIFRALKSKRRRRRRY